MTEKERLPAEMDDQGESEAACVMLLPTGGVASVGASAFCRVPSEGRKLASVFMIACDTMFDCSTSWIKSKGER